MPVAGEFAKAHAMSTRHSKAKEKATANVSWKGWESEREKETPQEPL